MNEYRNELPISDPKAVEWLLDYIDELVDKKLAKMAFDRTVVATVTAYDSGTGTASITLQSGVAVTGVKVTNGLVLTEDDKVHVCYPNNGLKAYIKDKIS